MQPFLSGGFAILFFFLRQLQANKNAFIIIICEQVRSR